MMRFIMPAILIGISVTLFFVITNPLYDDILSQRAQVAAYDEALNNSKALENQRDVLTAKENSIDAENLIKIKKLLPDNIDNIRLILEIGQLAMPYGMTLKGVKYNVPDDKKSSAPKGTGIVQGGGAVGQTGNKDYGIWDLEFSTSGSYSNFLNFTKNLESNLRIVDISSVDFSSEGSGGSSSLSAPSYTYNFKIKTYWLKN
ncbi:MAG: hypothetical protein V4699_00730 [Patescibacteria group bacterium]